MKNPKPVKTFEGVQDQVVIEVVRWAGLLEYWRNHNMDENADALELLDASGSAYVIEELESETPGQGDNWMTFVVYDEAVAKAAMKANVDQYIRDAIDQFDGPHIARG